MKQLFCVVLFCVIKSLAFTQTNNPDYVKGFEDFYKSIDGKILRHEVDSLKSKLKDIMIAKTNSSNPGINAGTKGSTTGSAHKNNSSNTKTKEDKRHKYDDAKSPELTEETLEALRDERDFLLRAAVDEEPVDNKSMGKKNEGGLTMPKVEKTYTSRISTPKTDYNSIAVHYYTKIIEYVRSKGCNLKILNGLKAYEKKYQQDDFKMIAEIRLNFLNYLKENC